MSFNVSKNVMKTNMLNNLQNILKLTCQVKESASPPQTPRGLISLYLINYLFLSLYRENNNNEI